MDLMLPEVDGPEVAPYHSAQSIVPIIVLSAKDTRNLIRSSVLKLGRMTM